MKQTTTVYICGPITGDPSYMRKFAAAEQYLKNQGLAVLNPARMFAYIAARGVSYEAIMRLCLGLVQACDSIAVLPGFQYSRGATQELNVYHNSHAIGKVYRLCLGLDKSKNYVVALD